MMVRSHGYGWQHTHTRAPCRITESCPLYKVLKHTNRPQSRDVLFAVWCWNAGFWCITSNEFIYTACKQGYGTMKPGERRSQAAQKQPGEARKTAELWMWSALQSLNPFNILLISRRILKMEKKIIRLLFWWMKWAVAGLWLVNKRPELQVTWDSLTTTDSISH